MPMSQTEEMPNPSTPTKSPKDSPNSPTSISSNPSRQRNLNHSEQDTLLPQLSLSITRICLAGFGGALAGLSIARRRNVATSMQSRNMPYTYLREDWMWGTLPLTWAVGCASFTGVVEASRFLEPTAQMMKWMQEIPNGSVVGEADGGQEREEGNQFMGQLTKTRAMHTLGDYAIAGSIAGAIFQGSRIEPSPSSLSPTASIKPPRKGSGTAQQRRRIGKGKVLNLSKSSSPTPPIPPSSIKPILHQASNTPMRRSILSGLGPGLLLGLVAGSIQCLIYGVEDWIAQQNYLEQEAMQKRTQEEEEEKELDDEMEKKLKLVQQMSTPEIEEEIRKLKLELSRKGSSDSTQTPNR